MKCINSDSPNVSPGVWWSSSAIILWRVSQKNLILIKMSREENALGLVFYFSKMYSDIF